MQKNKHIKKNSDYLGAFLVLLSSGTAFFYLMHTGATVFIFLLGSLLYAVRKKNRFDVIKGIPFILISLIMLNIFLWGFSIQHIVYIFFFCGAAIVCANSNFEEFRRAFFEGVFWLAVLSLLITIGCRLGILPYYNTVVSEANGDTFMSFFHRVDLDEFNFSSGMRLSGIYWEPGVYQMILNTALLFNMDVLQTTLFKDKRFTIKTFVILVALFFTFSTTGYIILYLLFVSYMMKKIPKKKLILMVVPTLAVMLAVLIYLLHSGVVSDKFDENNASFLIRFSDMEGMLDMIINNPLLGCGINSDKYRIESAARGLIANSNGLLYITTQLGCVFTFFLFCMLLKEAKRRKMFVSPLIYILVFILLNCGEPLTYSPIILLYILPFNNYKSLNNGKDIINYSANIQHGALVG